MIKNKELSAEYEKALKDADDKIRKGLTETALKPAEKGFSAGLVLGRSEAACQYLYCLNELGRHDEAFRASGQYFAAVKEDRPDEGVLSGALCAVLADSSGMAEEGEKLLKKLKLFTAESWRPFFSSFAYDCTQLSLIFNAAMVFWKTGRAQEGEKLLSEAMEHMLYVVDTETGGSRETDEETAEDFGEFLSLIKESPFKKLAETEVWADLADICR